MDKDLKQMLMDVGYSILHRDLIALFKYLEDEEKLPGLSEVRRNIPSDNPCVLLNFLINPCISLENQRPIDLLRMNRMESNYTHVINRVANVVQAAKQMYEAGK